MSERKPYLNLGCGNVLLPCPRPIHHQLVPELIYAYPDWLNVDKHAPQSLNGSGKFECVNVFEYPWPWEDGGFDGALLAHIVEHVPHEIRLIPVHEAFTTIEEAGGHYPKDSAYRAQNLAGLQDGWYAFFAELYRVLTPGAVAHVLAPYGWSQGAITDPTHTRLLTEHTFTHSMKPQKDDSFWYENGGIHFEVVGTPAYTLQEQWQHLQPHAGDLEATADYKARTLKEAFQTRLNVVYEIYVALQVIK